MKTVAYVRATNIYDDSRATKEILALAEAGYRVEVLAWDRNGKAQAECRRVFSAHSGQIFCTFYSAYAEKGIGMRNISKLLGWVSWVYKTLRSMEGIDAVHACNLDAGLGAYRYCRRTGVLLIYDVFDYYIDSHRIPGAAVGTVERLEIAVINHAAVTIICTEERAEQIAKARPKKVIVLHNSPDMDGASDREVTVDYAYCGSLGPRRLLGEILDAYEKNQDLKFTFAGYGGYSAQARELDKKCENFRFLGAIPYSQVLEVEAGAAAIAAVYEPTIRNHRLCAPNKFYEALALGKPVIVCRGTGIDRIVQQHRIGMVIEYDADAFYHALRYLKDNPAQCREMGLRGRALYEQSYRWSIMKDRLIDTYRELEL